MARSKQQQQKTRKQPRKVVTFPIDDDDEKLCSYHAGAVMDMIERTNDIWYRHSDMKNIKRDAMEAVKNARRRGLHVLLNDAYNTVTTSTMTASHNNNNNDDTSTGAPDSTTRSFMSWSRNAGARRGLERWVNIEYGARRSDMRKRTIKSVIKAQKKLLEEGVKDRDYCAKVLARLSEAFSQESRMLARVMGMADEQAIHQNNNDHDDNNNDEASITSKSSINSKSVDSTTSPTAIILTPHIPLRRKIGVTGIGIPDLRHYY